MYIRPHKLFEKFMAGVAAKPQASVVHSLSFSPTLGDFLDELDPKLSLDWSGESFYGMPALRHNVLQRTGTDVSGSIDDVLITAGAAEANFLAISQLVQPGDEMVVDVPGWPQPRRQWFFFLEKQICLAKPKNVARNSNRQVGITGWSRALCK